MTRSAFLKKYLLRFSASLALAALIAYTLYHVFGSSTGSLKWDYVRQETDVQIISADAYLFRDEEVLTVPSPGVVNDLVESGKKAGKNVALTEVWSSYSEQDREKAQERLDALNRIIGVLEASVRTDGATVSKAELYRTEAMRRYLAMRQSISTGEWEGLDAAQDELLIWLNRYDALTEEGSVQLSEALKKAKQERDALLIGASATVYNTQASGYFYDRNAVDGYEGSFTSAALDALTEQSFASLIASEPQAASGFSVGKLAYGNRWYLAIGFEASAAELFEETTSYDVIFPESESRSLTMRCTRCIARTDGGVIVVLASDEVPSEFDFRRVQKVRIEVGAHTGYSIPETALHTVNGVDGVYILKDSTVYFRRVEILYRGDGYCIVAEQGDRGDNYLALYDILVISGENLYDGRVYR